MKQVKYRLWCNNKKEWEKDEWHLTSDGIIIDTKRNIEMKKETHFLNQFTGLFDKQGVDIYEGDIIKYDFNELNYRIEFLNAEFIARRFYENIENLYPTEFDYGKECEVIGNIYENKELLN